jgi:O-6-methylguanine DNA methyltransferase
VSPVKRRVQCVTYASALLASAIDDAPLEPQVVRHVEQCPSCRAEQDAYRNMNTLIASADASGATDREQGRAFRRLMRRLDDLKQRQLEFGVFPSPLGPLLLGCSATGLALVRFVQRRHVDARRLSLFIGMDAVHRPEALVPVYEQLQALWSARRASLNWPLDFRFAHGPFQRRVLELTARLPHGAVASYGHLARSARRRNAAAAVARALRRNPLPLAIPCHRVVGSSGVVGDYAGGKAIFKQRLLAAEGIPLVGATRSSDVRINAHRLYVNPSGEDAYCLPTCRSLARLKDGRALFFASRRDAEAFGLRPCTTCRPDRNGIHLGETIPSSSNG